MAGPDGRQREGRPRAARRNPVRRQLLGPDVRDPGQGRRHQVDVLRPRRWTGTLGTFYSTPAVAFGRVYAGNADGRVYSFEQRTGDLAWSQSLSGYVYGAPAVADTPGTPPSVYIGSNGGTAYALDARDGGEIWSVDVGGEISGAGSVIGDVFYISDVDLDKTVGFDVASGESVYNIKRGEYNPMVSDGKQLYLTGYASITGLAPKSKQPKGTGRRRMRSRRRTRGRRKPHPRRTPMAAPGTTSAAPKSDPRARGLGFRGISFRISPQMVEQGPWRSPARGRQSMAFAPTTCEVTPQRARSARHARARGAGASVQRPGRPRAEDRPPRHGGVDGQRSIALRAPSPARARNDVRRRSEQRIGRRVGVRRRAQGGRGAEGPDPSRASRPKAAPPPLPFVEQLVGPIEGSTRLTRRRTVTPPGATTASPCFDPASCLSSWRSWP